MKQDPILWKRPTTGIWYVLYYKAPLYLERRMESLKTRDRARAEDLFYLWKRNREREEREKIRLGITLGDAIAQYLAHFAKGNRPASVTRYRDALAHLVAYVGDDLVLTELDVRTLQDYQLVRTPVVEARTVDYELDVIRALLNWCRKRNWVRDNVASKTTVGRLTRGARNKTHQRIFTDDELAVLLAADDPSWPDLRVALAMLYYTGLRIGELGHLLRKDVRADIIQVRSKTLRVPVRGRKDPATVEWKPKWGEDRVVPVDVRLAPYLAEFQQRRRENIWGLYLLSREGFLLSDHLSRTIQGLLGGTPDVSVHTFRHTHISHALNRWGRNPSIVQRWVGHRDLQTTQRYLHVDLEDLRREARKVGDDR